MADPLGRKHQTIKIPKNRHNVDRVCDWILNDKELKACFKRKPTSEHVYFDAYLVLFGSDEAYKMLSEARDK